MARKSMTLLKSMMMMMMFITATFSRSRLPCPLLLHTAGELGREVLGIAGTIIVLLLISRSSSFLHVILLLLMMILVFV